MQKGAAYIRVSTDDQLEFSPDAQKRAIFEYAKKNNIYIANEYIFIDEGISGRNAEKRPAFMKMISKAKQKPCPFELILVHKYDRFARNREDSVVYKSLLRKECGVKVISITEQMEDDKFSIILESMLEAMAEYYSLNLADEVKKGMFEKARRGEHIGKAPYGYNLINKQLVINEHEANILRMIYDLYTNQNKSLSYIVRFCNENNIYTKSGGKWRVHTLSYMLSNPVYTGLTRYNYISKDKYRPKDKSEWIIAQGSHPPIITKELFDKTCKLLNKNKVLNFETSKSKNVPTWLMGLMECSECGCRLNITSSANKYFSYRCISSQYSQCSNKGSISTNTVEKIVLKTIENDLKSPEYLEFVNLFSRSLNDKINILTNNFNKVKEKKELAKKSYFSGVDTIAEYKTNKLAFDREENEIIKKIEKLKKEKSLEKETIISNTKNYMDLLKCTELSISDKNAVAKQFIAKVELNIKNKTLQVFYYV